MHRTRTFPLALRTCFILGACIALDACSTANKRAADEAAARKNLAAEIDRICALSEAERIQALAKLRKQTGFELQCAHP